MKRFLLREVAIHMRLWDIENQKELQELKGHVYPYRVSALAFSPDGQLLASGSWDETVRLWNIGGHRALAKMKGHEFGVGSLAFSPDGEKLASGSLDCTARVWDIRNQEELIETHKL